MFSGPQREEVTDLSGNNTLKSKMDRFCTNFWIEARAEYPVILKIRVSRYFVIPLSRAEYPVIPLF